MILINFLSAMDLDIYLISQSIRIDPLSNARAEVLREGGLSKASFEAVKNLQKALQNAPKSEANKNLSDIVNAKLAENMKKKTREEDDERERERERERLARLKEEADKKAKEEAERKKLKEAAKKTITLEDWSHLTNASPEGDKTFYAEVGVLKEEAKKNVSGYYSNTPALLQALQPKVAAHPQNLHTTTLQYIQEIYDRLKKDFNLESQLFYVTGIPTGVDIFKITATKNKALVENGVFQVASQFNFLESMGVYYTPPEDYYKDRTQGPLASLSCPIALLRRGAKFKNLSDEKIQPLFESSGLTSKHGYLLLNQADSVLGSKEQEEALRQLKENIGDLLTFAQEGRTLWDIDITQVFQAAPSFQGKRQPAKGSLNAQICELLVIAQYKALAQLAVIKSIITGKKVPLHLTALGQGAFNNPPYIREKMYEAVIEEIQGFNVDVYFHAYNPDEAEDAIKALRDAGNKIEDITTKDFMEASYIQQEAEKRQAEEDERVKKEAERKNEEQKVQAQRNEIAHKPISYNATKKKSN